MAEYSPEHRIVHDLADAVAQRIARTTIRHIQAMNSPDELLSNDSVLANVWDEVCVQMQDEESLYWETYLATITPIIDWLVSQLKKYELEALWLATPEGEDWLWEDEDERRPFGPCAEDVVQHILHDYVLKQAADWNNPRIREFLNRRYLD